MNTALKAIIAIVAWALLSASIAHGQNFDLEVSEVATNQTIIIPGDTVFPRAKITNIGQETSPPFLLLFQIFGPDSQSVYGPDFVEAPGLAPGVDSARSFQANLPWLPELPGAYTLQAKLIAEGDQNPQNDSLTTEISVYAGKLSRQQAIAIVEEQVIPQSPFADQLVGFLYHRTGPDSTLQPGTTITPWDSSFSKTISSESYFFWFDNEPEMEWLHAATFGFVNAWTGEVETFEAQSWPVIDGVEIDHFMSEDEDSPDKIHGKYPKSIARFTYKARETDNKQDWVIIVVGRNLHGTREKIARKNDIARLQDCLNGTATGPQVTKENFIIIAGADTTGATMEEIFAKLEGMKGKKCRKLYFHYIGHGYRGGLILKKKGKKGTHKLSYKKLARKFLQVGVGEVCITIEACYSGTAISAMSKEKLKVKGKKIHLKGTLITSSPYDRTTHRSADGAEFIKALHKCCKDPNADLNRDKKITLVEAVAWARIKNKVVDFDNPQGVILSDRRRIAFYKPRSRVRNSGADRAGNLVYEARSYCYGIEKKPGSRKFNQVCRIFLYVYNPFASPHGGGRKVDIYCIDSRGRRKVVKTFKPLLAKKQRKCILELPSDCRDFVVKPHRGRQQLAGFDPQAGNVVSQWSGAYLPGELVFQHFEIPDDSLNQYQADIQAESDWGFSIDPQQFTSTAMLDTEIVLIRGVVPDNAQEGQSLTASLINTTLGDTALFRINALVFDSLGVPVDGGRSFRWRLLDLYAGVHARKDTLRFENTTLQFQTPGIFAVDSAAVLAMRNTAVRPDSAGSFSLQLHGDFYLDDASFVEPQNGLQLENPTGEMVHSSILLSGGDGMTLRGDLSRAYFDFLFIDGSAGNGLVVMNAGQDTLSSIRIENSGMMDIVARDQADIVLLDCDYDSGKELVQDNAKITRAWSTGFALVDSAGQPVTDVAVKIEDSAGTIVFQDSTIADGFVGPVALVEYQRTAVEKRFETPHRVTFTFAGRDTTIAYAAKAQENVEITLPASFTPVHEAGTGGPAAFSLRQNYPNPFGEKLHVKRTTIVYTLPLATDVTFTVYNVLGQEVLRRQLGRQRPGRHTLRVDARRFAPGLYFYEIRTQNKHRLLRKMLILH